MSVCMLFVFCALLEYAIVNVISRHEIRQLLLGNTGGGKTISTNPDKTHPQKSEVTHYFPDFTYFCVLCSPWARRFLITLEWDKIGPNMPKAFWFRGHLKVKNQFITNFWCSLQCLRRYRLTLCTVMRHPILLLSMNNSSWFVMCSTEQQFKTKCDKYILKHCVIHFVMN